MGVHWAGSRFCQAEVWTPGVPGTHESHENTAWEGTCCSAQIQDPMAQALLLPPLHRSPELTSSLLLPLQPIKEGC